jgi:nicotinamidase/pyrazinamidase
MKPKDALLLIDVQNDFFSGGALPVSEGEKILPVLNGYIEQFRKANLPILATRDWHPEKTCHFNTCGGVWPPHCIQGTTGAEFHAGLALSEDVVIISCGVEPDEEGYSGFDGRDASGSSLADVLRDRGVERLWVGGLATDYCVKLTVLDALKQGFKVALIQDAIRGVDLQPGDSQRAIDEMMRAGAEKHSRPVLI